MNNTTPPPVPGNFYPLLDKTIIRILETPIPREAPEAHQVVMRHAKRRFRGKDLTRRGAEIHALRFLMSHAEVSYA